MGVLTDDMTRLRAEIETLRAARKSLARDLVHHTNNRRQMVAAIRACFRSDHATMARAATVDRAAFVTGLQRAVSHMRNETRTELMGARHAWRRMVA